MMIDAHGAVVHVGDRTRNDTVVPGDNLGRQCRWYSKKVATRCIGRARIAASSSRMNTTQMNFLPARTEPLQKPVFPATFDDSGPSPLGCASSEAVFPATVGDSGASPLAHYSDQHPDLPRNLVAFRFETAS
jgi:hypothetical protein